MSNLVEGGARLRRLGGRRWGRRLGGRRWGRRLGGGDGEGDCEEEDGEEIGREEEMGRVVIGREKMGGRR